MAGNFAAAPVLLNLTLTNANTEYTVALPAGTTHFEMQARGNANVRFAFETSLVATPTSPYMTLKAGYTYSSYNLWGSQMIYSPGFGRMALSPHERYRHGNETRTSKKHSDSPTRR